MKPAEVALIVDRKSFQEISLWEESMVMIVSHRKLGLSACICFPPASNLTPTKKAQYMFLSALINRRIQLWHFIVPNYQLITVSV